MNDDRKIGRVDEAGAAKATPQVGRAAPAAATLPVAAAEAVRAAQGPAAVVAALAARLAEGGVDRPQAVRSLVGEVVHRELDGLDVQVRETLIDEVVAALADEPAWQARLDGLLDPEPGGGPG